MFGRRCDLYPNRFNGNISLVSNAGWVLMVSIKNNNNRTEQPNIVSNFYWMTALIFSGKILLSTTRSFSFFTWRVSGAVMIDIFLVRYRCRFKITANTFHLYAAISLLLSRTHTHRQWNTLFHLFRRHRCNGRCFFFHAPVHLIFESICMDFILLFLEDKNLGRFEIENPSNTLLLV